MSQVRARAAIAGLAVVAIALTTAAGFPAKTNPKDLAIAKASVLQQADVPSGFVQVKAKITKSKPSGIRACKRTEGIDKLTTAKAKSEFDAADGSSIGGEVDTFKSPAALKKAIDAIAAPDSVTCLKQQANRELAKTKATKNLTHSVTVTPQSVTAGDRSVGYLVTLTVGASGASQTLTIYAGVVGVGRAGTQVTFTDTSGTPDPAAIQQVVQAAASRLTAAQQ
jgi:hypothetical protein